MVILVVPLHLLLVTCVMASAASTASSMLLLLLIEWVPFDTRLPLLPLLARAGLRLIAASEAVAEGPRRSPLRSNRMNRSCVSSTVAGRKLGGGLSYNVVALQVKMMMTSHVLKWRHRLSQGCTLKYQNSDRRQQQKKNPIWRRITVPLLLTARPSDPPATPSSRP